MVRAFLALSLIIVAPSCFWKPQKHVSTVDTSCDADRALDSFFDSISERESLPVYDPVLVTSSDALAEYEARLIDVPNYISAQLVKGSVVDDGHDNQYIQLHYQFPTDPQEIRLFYSKEMERHGWCQYAAMFGIESVLVFEKPEKICSIIIRPLASSSKKNAVTTTTVLMTVGSKIAS